MLGSKSMSSSQRREVPSKLFTQLIQVFYWLPCMMAGFFVYKPGDQVARRNLMVGCSQWLASRYYYADVPPAQTGQKAQCIPQPVSSYLHCPCLALAMRDHQILFRSRARRATSGRRSRSPFQETGNYAYGEKGALPPFRSQPHSPLPAKDLKQKL